MQIKYKNQGNLDVKMPK